MLTIAAVTALAAQAQADPLSGGAGWVGAGLLGLVLAWLMFWHLPAKDKQHDDLVTHFTARLEKKDTQIDGQRAEFTAALDRMTAAFKSESAAERQACEKHFATLAESMNAAFKTLGEQLSQHGLRNQQWIELMKTELQRLTALQGRPPQRD